MTVFEKLIIAIQLSGYDGLKCTLKYHVDGSTCHFKFPKVVLAHILREVGTMHSFGKCLF